ncbi:MAG: sigma 54-interacting transcriptional regulator [Myxococcaceae bacterium]|nr:sigma 54-interacting transcriptional regulator [Myxococcaceae bacterium]
MRAHAAPPPVDLTRDLRDLVRFAAAREAVPDLLRRGLDWLARIAPYDLATVFLLRDSKLVVQVARGKLATARVKGHAISLSDFPTIQEALESRRARAFTEADHAHGDGDPFDDVVGFPPGHACMVVPLCAGDQALGVLTLDRAVCETYPEPVVNLVEVYGQVLALALQKAKETETLERLHEQDHAHVKLLESELGGEAAVLETSRAPAVRAMARRAKQVAQTQTPVLLLGETGTGKERLARAIHAWSPRADHPFVAINCASIPAGLLESELFGHVRGAYTGANRDRPGRFQMANGGTLLLDEVGELPLELQAKLLRALQEGSFEPVGSDRSVKVDVRIIAATHVDLEKAIRERRFREDLFYRLNVFPLRVPPLRERLEDLPLLCEVLLHEQARRTGRSGMRVSRDGLAKLRRHMWPGNIRELANVLERATIIAPDRVLGPDVLDLPERDDGTPREVVPPSASALKRVKTLDEVQRDYIRDVLALTHGRIYGKGGAAQLLGMKPSTLQSRMAKLGIERPRA